MKKYVIPITIPYSQMQENSITEDEVKKIIEEHLNKISNDEYIVEVAFVGIDIESNEELLEIVYEYIKLGKVNHIRIITTTNHINKQFLNMLKKYKVKTIELEIPSTNEYILKKTGIEYSLKDMKKAVKLIKWKRFDLGLQMMLGLPESTKIDDINTAKTIIKMNPKIVSIIPTLVLKGTELEKAYKENTYKPLALVQAVEACKELVELFNNKKIEIIAIGYGSLDNEIEEQSEVVKNIIDGPFHPAFRQLVESSLWYDAIVNKIKKLNVKVMQVEVTVNPIDTNNVIGYKQENITKLKDTYDVDLVVTSDENIKQGKSKIEITKTYKDFIES